MGHVAWSSYVAVYTTPAGQTSAFLATLGACVFFFFWKAQNFLKAQGLNKRKTPSRGGTTNYNQNVENSKGLGQTTVEIQLANITT